MPGIYSQDHYRSREGIVRILKMANEALVRSGVACYAWSLLCKLSTPTGRRCLTK
jgi:hypothetical protein